jgi:hypothetical protein
VPQEPGRPGLVVDAEEEWPIDGDPLHYAARKVELLGIAVNPGGHWMEQMARNLGDSLDGFLLGKRYLLLDRDPLYTQAFRRILDQAGVKTARLPAHSPDRLGGLLKFYHREAA